VGTVIRWATRASRAVVVDGGYAPTEVTIEGVLHEYSTIDGVREDVVHIMLNLKGVYSSAQSRRSNASSAQGGEGPVTASDIQTPHDVEIIILSI